MNNKIWVTKYRPTTIDDYIFESENDQIKFTDFIKEGSINGNLILSGEPGTGKSSLIKILIKSLIKNKTENIIVCPKKIDELRSNLFPKLLLKPRGDIKRIIIMEELQVKNYSYDVLIQLKDKYMEEFQEYNTFIATTNHLSQLSEALIDRFRPNIFTLGKKEEKNKIFRLNQLMATAKYILDSEDIKYENNDLKSFVLNNNHLNIRRFINELQNHCYTGKLTSLQLSYNNTGSPDEIIDLTLTMFKKIIDCNDRNERRNFTHIPKTTSIVNEYNRLLQIITNNHELDYKYIFTELYSKLDFFIPLMLSCGNHCDLLDNRRTQFVNYLSFIKESFEILVNITELNNIDLVLLKQNLDNK